jgi:hypothetical protein
MPRVQNFMGAPVSPVAFALLLACSTSSSQSFISFAVLGERTMRDIFFSSLPKPDSFGRRIARRSCAASLLQP